MITNDNLSRAASAVWNLHEFEARDYEMDGSGDCGPMIGAHHRAARIAAVARWGFSPTEYNAELRRRLLGEDGRMSYSIYCLLGALEIEAATCEDHGEQAVVRIGSTGGFDPYTVLHLACGDSVL